MLSGPMRACSIELNELDSFGYSVVALIGEDDIRSLCIDNSKIKSKSLKDTPNKHTSNNLFAILPVDGEILVSFNFQDALSFLGFRSLDDLDMV